MTLPLVSICIPTYNRSAMLKEAIASALAMDYPNIEVVVSDNASTDDTAQVVQGFNDDRIKYFRNERNIGAFLNFRKVLYEYAQGEYAIYQSDDNYFIDNSYITDAINLMMKNKKVNIVFSNWRLVRPNLTRDFKLQFQEQVSSGTELVLNYFIQKEQRNNDLLLMFYSAVFRRKLAVDLDAMSTECVDTDVPFMLKIASHGSVGFFDKISVVQRGCGGGSILPYSIFFESMFKVGNSLTEHLKRDKAFSKKQLKTIRRISSKMERNALFSKMLIEVNKKHIALFSSLWKFVSKVYAVDPVLLLFILKPRMLVQIFLSKTPWYMKFKDMFGTSQDYAKV